MNDQINVYVVKYSGRKNYYMCFDDPVTGKQEKRTTGTAKKKEAAKVAGAWQAELNAGTYTKTSRLTWQQFTDTYESEVYPKLSSSTQTIRDAVFNHVVRMLNPTHVYKVATTRMMAKFQTMLREEGFPDSTITAYLSHLRSVFNWAKRQGFIAQAPEFDMPKIANDALHRGRAITADEFGRLLVAVPKVRKRDADRWKYFLRGLWWSGLRLGEGLQLSWDTDQPFCIWIEPGKLPRFRIYSEAQKNRKSQFLPMAPEFWELVSSTPEDERTGPVLPIPNHHGEQLSLKRVSRNIGQIGREAMVKTGEDSYATAHDLRRAFGTRWAKLVKPLVLQKLMRHTKLETTMRFYANLDVDWTSEEVWNAKTDHSTAQSAESVAE